ncbi:DUF1090 family protein [Helicobacter sp. 13S00477-4]|uniref:DUF1090 family protein n=1 Tax=Helicobacter sp. 13S00477-4 TaxID=1905759 RepID=UPI000BA597A6|nr:DUF1090 family protein [Helicobacter sp. 13S00477-4]PAF52569.1 hypothetical protein BKH44_01970 [Helicobacter sp. 13S00477-4]
MKKVIILGALALSILSAGPICDWKAKDVQSQIDFANKNGHKDKVDGLQKALKELKDHCSDAKVLKESQLRVDKLEKKFSEATDKLKESKKKDKASKIKKAEMKLKLIQTELESAKKELQQMKDLQASNKA